MKSKVRQCLHHIGALLSDPKLDDAKRTSYEKIRRELRKLNQRLNRNEKVTSEEIFTIVGKLAEELYIANKAEVHAETN